MADHLRDELDKLLNQYDAQRLVVAAREQKVKEEDARFVAQFAELRRGVIRPAFEVAAAMLAERGHKVSIAEQEFTLDPAGRITEGGISIHVVPAGGQSSVADERGRALTVGSRLYNKTVWFSTGKPLEGSKGSYAPEKVDRELVEAELIAFIAGVVAG